MELKQLLGIGEKAFIFLLIVPYGIETTWNVYNITGLKTFNRTLWN